MVTPRPLPCLPLCLYRLASGITQAQISRILSGDSANIRMATLRAIAQALGCRTVDLLPPKDH